MLIRHLPAESATRRVLDETSPWGLPEQLLAAAVDALQAANWQRQGGKGTRPKPIPRPGVRDRSSTRHHFGRVSRPPHEVADYLDKFKPPPRPYPETFGQPPPD